MSSRCVLWLLGAALSLTVLSCDDPLMLPQRIVRTRVLAARVEVGGDPSKAWPEAGESLTIRWLVVDPDAGALFSWDLRACVARATPVGLPVCEAPPFAVDRHETSDAREPVLSFVSPEAPEQDSIVFVRGVICSRGRPAEGADGCSGEGAEGDRVVLTFPLAAAVSNGNPSLADDTLRFDASDWLAPEVAESDACSGEEVSAALPTVRAGAFYPIEVELGGTDREILGDGEGSYGGDGERETLQFVYASTAGTLDEAYGYVEADAPAAGQRLSVGWTAPAVSAPVRVRFYIVVRDLRGGCDWTRREACVVP